MFSMEFRSDTPCFQRKPTDAAHDVLCMIVQRVSEGATNGVIRDVDGNKIGHWLFDHDYDSRISAE